MQGVSPDIKDETLGRMLMTGLEVGILTNWDLYHDFWLVPVNKQYRGLRQWD